MFMRVGLSLCGCEMMASRYDGGFTPPFLPKLLVI